jgi:hypothetical protein
VDGIASGRLKARAYELTSSEIVHVNKSVVPVVDESDCLWHFLDFVPTFY